MHDVFPNILNNPGLLVIKDFVLNSTEHEIYPAYKLFAFNFL